MRADSRQFQDGDAGDPVDGGRAPRGRAGLCVLAVDVGNTSTRFGLFGSEAARGDEPLVTWELTTPARLTADEARMQVAQVLGVLARDVAARGLGPSRAESLGRPPLGSILSCVVPALVEPWRQALRVSCQTRPLVVGPGLRTGMRMDYHDPSEVGPDRIADAVAAREAKGSPVVSVDLGTTTNIEVVDASGSFLGGIIAPGVALEARSLAGAAARLPQIELEVPRHVIGKSTREAMLSGVVLGEAERIDGLLARIEEELGTSAPVVVTGRGAERVAKLLSHDCVTDDTLTLRGLHQLYLTNTDSRGTRPRRG